jgi:hypothetical protein
MTAGAAQDLAYVNMAAGQYAAAVARSLADAAAFSAALSNPQRFGGLAGLTSVQGFTTADATLLLNSFGDLANLSSVARGVAGFQVQIGSGPLGASNFMFNAQQLLGTLAL